jgi:hypothetical protein
MSKNNWGNYTQSELVQVNGGVIFISYNTPVGILLNNGTAMKTDFSFSRTTSKQLGRFFNENGVNRDSIKKLNKELFVGMLNQLGFNGGMGWLSSPYFRG